MCGARACLVAAGTLAALIALTSLPASSAAAPAAPPLVFRINEGREINLFLRRGAIAAHLVLRCGTEPRILVAFPAGDSGVGLWFDRTARPVTWTVVAPPHAVVLPDSKGRPLRGIQTELAVDAPELRIRQAVLSPVRVLRDFQRQGMVPAQVRASAVVTGNRVSWARDRLDGAPGYRLSLEALGGTVSATVIRGRGAAPIRLRVLALTGEQPLTPLGGASLLTPAAAPDRRERNVLAYLSYREKYLAGSWRFDTYFGRDTLMSLTLLAPVLQPQAVESGIRSVLARLARDGEVAHEEEIGEFAILKNLAAGRGLSAQPIYDYDMIDESFMLAPAAARWLLDSPAGRADGAQFLATRNRTGEREADALVRNLLWVVGRTEAFAARPIVANLVGLKAGQTAGDWRDSRDGLGGGRYPYDVNAVFVPAALGATFRLARSGLLDPYLTPAQRVTLMRAGAQRDVWAGRAPVFFVITVSARDARADVSGYAQRLGVAAAPAIAALHHRSVTFYALSLDASGRPIPVMHSDVGFALLFEAPPPEALERILSTVARPFPAGLLSPVGLLVANPVFASMQMQGLFTRMAYHGTVVWAWQQAVLAAGLERQLARRDLTPDLHGQLVSACARLWSAIRSSRQLRASELWSWSFTDGRYRAEPFGQGAGQTTESDAAQLWSTVFLAIR
jgi:hypothetical protein